MARSPEQATAERIAADLGTLCLNVDMGYSPSTGTLLEVEWARLGAAMADMGHDVTVLHDGLVIDGVSVRLDGDCLKLHYSVTGPAY